MRKKQAHEMFGERQALGYVECVEDEQGSDQLSSLDRSSKVENKHHGHSVVAIVLCRSLPETSRLLLFIQANVEVS